MERDRVKRGTAFARSVEAWIVEAQASIFQRGVPILTGLVVTFLHGSALVHDSSWSGSFVLPADGFLGLGGPYELVLEDGRSARVLVKAMREEEGEVFVEFVGIGAFPHKG